MQHITSKENLPYQGRQSESLVEHETHTLALLCTCCVLIDIMYDPGRGKCQPVLPETLENWGSQPRLRETGREGASGSSRMQACKLASYRGGLHELRNTVQ